MACTGFVTKVASFGLHVSFYGNVFGLLPAKALTRHGIQEPSEAFTPGQVNQAHSGFSHTAVFGIGGSMNECRTPLQIYSQSPILHLFGTLT